MPGAGFFVAPGKVVTCVHVIGDSPTLVVRWERDGQQPVELPVCGRALALANRGRPIPALDRDYPDIAVLEVNGLDGHPCVGIDAEWPSPEDGFQVFGYPQEGGAVQLTPARLTYRGTKGILPTTYLDLASDTVKPGMSGAAVLNLRSGAVCGVIVASKHPAHPDGALAIPWSAVDTDLSEVLAANRAFHLKDRRWNAAEFDRRWRCAIGRSTHLSRQQMEDFANLWQLAEQVRQRVSLACDAKTREGTCRGWDEFSNADISRFCADLLGKDVLIES